MLKEKEKVGHSKSDEEKTEKVRTDWLSCLLLFSGELFRVSYTINRKI